MVGLSSGLLTLILEKSIVSQIHLKPLIQQHLKNVQLQEPHYLPLEFYQKQTDPDITLKSTLIY